MKILASGALPYVARCSPGDRFVLHIDGKEVHSREITQMEVISHWAAVALPGVGEGYFVGTEELFVALKALEA